MADPPSYEESNAESSQRINSKSRDIKCPQRLSIREEVGASRSRYVGALVAKLLPYIEERAKRGFSKSMLLLLPAMQDSNYTGQLVGFPKDELPTIIQLEGSEDTVEFWAQDEVLKLLQAELFAALADVPSPPRSPEIETRSVDAGKARKSSFWGTKSNAPAVSGQSSRQAARPRVTVDVQLDEAHFRAETEYGLYQTARVRCISVMLELR